MIDPELEWDDGKAERNIARHGVAFEAIRAFAWETSATEEDRRAFGERRFTSAGLIGGRLHVAIWTVRRRGDRVRLISLRKANAREVRRYLQRS